MYCIECGISLPQTSKFCSHCGAKQGIVQHLPEDGGVTATTNVVPAEVNTKEDKTSLNYNFLRDMMPFYIGWVLLQLCFLLVKSDSILGLGECKGECISGYSSYSCKRPNSNFWPFSTDSIIGNYDIRDFLVYTIFPIAILVIFSMLNNNVNTTSLEDETESKREDE